MGAKKSNTVSAIGWFPVNGIGERRFPSCIAKTVRRYRSPNINYRCCCPTTLIFIPQPKHDYRTHAHPHSHQHTHDDGHDHAHPHSHSHHQEDGHEHAHVHPHQHDHAHEKQALLFVENVGNLVCPAMWDLGEKAKVAILSVTEGEDKPRKYPDMFAASKLMVLNKIDLLPHVSFNVARCKEFARRVNPGIQILELSATTGEGMGAWLDWLLAEPSAAAAPVEAVAARIAALEAELAKLRALPA